MEKTIINRILKKLHIPDLPQILAGNLSNPDLNSLLLYLFDLKTGQISPSNLLRQYKKNPYVKPSDDDPVIIRKLDLCAFSLLHPVFTPVEISPVLPLGSCSAIAKVNQKKILTATRGTEVLSDITNALALECAVRRIACIKTKQTKKHIHLCAGHRHIRTQPIEDEHFRPHFYLFGLCSAGQDQGTMKFETGALFIHLKFYLDFFSAIMKNGITYNVKIVFTDFSGKVSSYIEKTLFREIPRVYPGVKMEWNNNREHAKHYYFPVCFAMSFSIGGEKTYGYIDGGFTDWTAKLTGNRKERLLTSGISFTYILNTIREYLVL